MDFQSQGKCSSLVLFSGVSQLFSVMNFYACRTLSITIRYQLTCTLHRHQGSREILRSKIFKNVQNFTFHPPNFQDIPSNLERRYHLEKSKSTLMWDSCALSLSLEKLLTPAFHEVTRTGTSKYIWSTGSIWNGTFF